MAQAIAEWEARQEAKERFKVRPHIKHKRVCSCNSCKLSRRREKAMSELSKVVPRAGNIISLFADRGGESAN